jgi:hypothetical protein
MHSSPPWTRSGLPQINLSSRWLVLTRPDLAGFARPATEALWAAAVKAAEAYGLARIARVLRLDYYTLKKHVETSSAHGAPEQEASATFVELASPVSAGTRECLLELEDPDGAKMRVHLKGIETPDLVALSRSFWSAEG